MQLTVRQSDLAKGLDIVSRAVSTKTTLPILHNILLSAEMNDFGAWQLRLAATNLEIGITVIVPCKVDTEGATTVPARLFVDLVKSLLDDLVHLEYVEKGKQLLVKSGRNQSKVKCIDAEDFPTMPSLPDDYIDMDAATIRSLIDFAVAAAADDMSRPIMTGINWQLASGKLTTAATDGFRMSVASTNGLPTEPNITCLIPCRAMTELSKLLVDGETTQFARTPDRNQAIFQVGGVTIVSQLIEGNAPGYHQIIPRSIGTTIVADRRAFQQSVRQAALFARDGQNKIVLRSVLPGPGMDFGVLHVAAVSTEYGDVACQIDVVVEGNPSEVTFNATYLADALRAVTTEQVKLELTPGSTHGVFRPTTGDFIHVVMPMGGGK